MSSPNIQPRTSILPTVQEFQTRQTNIYLKLMKRRKVCGKTSPLKMGPLHFWFCDQKSVHSRAKEKQPEVLTVCRTPTNLRQNYTLYFSQIKCVKQGHSPYLYIYRSTKSHSSSQTDSSTKIRRYLDGRVQTSALQVLILFKVINLVLRDTASVEGSLSPIRF